jgi:RNA polymerase sigma factor (sigma-70 family)
MQVVATRAAGILSPADQRTLAIAAQHGYEPARELLVVANMGMVKKLANRYQGQGLDFEDLVQEGTAGLIRAVDKYAVDDNDHKARSGGNPASFPTYASWWIREGIVRSIQNTGSVIRTPVAVGQLIQRAEIAIKQLEAMEEDAPSPERILDQINMGEAKPATLEQLQAALEVIERRMISKDQAIGDEGDAVRERVLALDDAADVVEELFSDQFRRDIRDAVEGLPALEREVVSRKFGLNGRVETTNQQLAVELGMTRGALDNVLRRSWRLLQSELDAYASSAR